MANRLMAGRSYSHERERKVVSGRVSFGASGAPTLDGVNSKGILSVARNSAGNYTFVFGTSGGQTILDAYVKLLAIETDPDVSYISGTAPAAVGQPAVYRNDIDSGINLPAPTGGAAAAVGTGGTFAAGTYFWKVTAVDSQGNESLASAEFSQTLVLNGSANLSWTVVPGAVTYRVYRGASAGAESVVYAGITTNAFTDTNGANQASAANQIQTRPPIAAASLTVQLLNGSGVATDPAQGEALFIQFDFGDFTGA